MAITARELSIPSPATYIQDFGLNVSAPPSQRNKRVVILGTSEDGPMYEPIQIEKPEDAEYVWGRIGAGDLVRGIFECWDVQGGNPTVVGVRIGNGVKSLLEIEESTGSLADTEFGGNLTSLKLEALNPGAIYNGISISYNENREVAIYNPKTGQTSTFSVDTEHPTNTNVDAHNVAELVDAINADTNLSQILVASYSGIVSDYEVAISGTSIGVSNISTNAVELRLQDILANGYVTTDGFMVPNPVNTGISASNNIQQIEAIEAVSISEWELVECAGKATNSLALMPLDGKSPAFWNTIQALYDYNSDSEWVQDPSGIVATSEFIYNLSYALMDGGTGEGGPTRSGGYYSSGSPTNTIRISVPICLDDSEETSTSGIAHAYILANNGSGETYANFSGIGWQYATCSGVTTKNVNGNDVRPSGKIIIQAGLSTDPNDHWQTLPYNVNSGIYLQSYDDVNDVAVFGVGPTAYLDPVMQTLVYSNNAIRPDVYLRVVANTIKGFLTEKENLNALDTTAATLSQYFVRGQEVIFNRTPAFNMYVNYGTRISYSVGGDVELSDAANGIFTFNNPELLPGPGGGPLANDKKTYIRFRYSYLPTWPNITTSAKSFSGGTDGNLLNGRQRKEELNNAYERLRNYGADLWVPMGAYIDELTERFNPITGLKETIPVDFTGDLVNFLEDLSINTIQPHAILGVKPMTEVSHASKDSWVKRLTIRDIKDPNRGANIMSLIQSKFLSVVAFEPVFLNIGRGRSYVANGQAAYAGVLASMQYDLSPTNKPVIGIQSLRYSLSTTQYESLNSMRYVTMKTRPGKVPVIIEDVTAAAPGSDFVNWSTFSITAEASNRVYSIAESFIGRPNSIEVRTSLEQIISNTLMSMSGLRAFDFSMSSTPTQQVLGIIEIDLILVPIFTIKKIRTTVKLRKNLPVR
jgi:hypothetical protein